jgi:hypothetical protein
MPVQLLPKMFQTIAPAVPQYHLGQLALSAVGAAPGSNTPGHIAALAITRGSLRRRIVGRLAPQRRERVAVAGMRLAPDNRTAA